MSDQIQADYGKLKKAQDKFVQQSQIVSGVLKDMRAKLQPLQGGKGWQGSAANKFFREMHDDLLPRTQRLEKALSEAADVVKQVTKTVQNAEQEAKNAFRVF